MPVVAGVNIWQYLGFNMLFFFAGLQAIPKSLYEAAEIDGASKWGQFWRISLPLLNPTMLFVLVTDVIGSFQVFDTLYVLTGGTGGPGDSTKVMSLNIYDVGFVGTRYGRRRHCPSCCSGSSSSSAQASSCSSGTGLPTSTRHEARSAEPAGLHRGAGLHRRIDLGLTRFQAARSSVFYLVLAGGGLYSWRPTYSPSSAR